MEAKFPLKEMLFVLFVIAALTFAVMRGRYVEESEAVAALEKHGFTEVQVRNKIWFLAGARGCSGGDAVRFDAWANNPGGQQVSVSVCIGWPLKGATVRTR